MGSAGRRVQRKEKSALAHRVSAEGTHGESRGSFEYECLRLLFGILVASGLRRSQLRKVSDLVLDGLQDSGRRWNPADLYYFDRLSHVVSLWHLLEGYVGARAAPRPLALYSRGPCLSKLIGRVFPDESPEAVLTTLANVGAVRRTGDRWLPTSRTLIFKSPRVASLRILSDLIHFLATAAHNITHSRGKLLQRSAFNPAVPVRELTPAAQRLGEAAEALLVEHDADLERRARSPKGSEPTVGSGVGVYAYRAIRWRTGPPVRARLHSARKKRVR